MKKAILISLFLFFSLTLSAQQKVNVVLKSGKTVYGTLVNSLFEDFITVEYSPLDRENIPIENINSINFGDYQPTKLASIKDPTTFFHRQRGYFHATEFQLVIGQGSGGFGYSNVSLQTVNGFAFNPHLMVGLGTGLDKYGDFMFTPLYASVRGLVMERKTSPFYYLNAGWGFMWKPEDRQQDWVNIDYQDYGGGYHLQGGVGYQINMKGSALTLGMGYRLQKTSLSYSMSAWDWNGETETEIDEKRLLRRLVLSAGFTF